MSRAAVGAMLFGLVWWQVGLGTAILVLFGAAFIDGMIESRRETAAAMRAIGGAILDWAKWACRDRVLIVGGMVIQAAFGGVEGDRVWMT